LTEPSGMAISSHQRRIAMTARRPKPVHQMTSAQFDALFPVGDEEACRTYLIARRWPNGVRCPRCGNDKVYALASGYHWQCEQCAVNGYRFSHIAGTIFENTNKPLRDWFKITHLILTSKKGMSARQLGRYMGFGSVKTAWLMAHKIRTALIEPEEKLGGIVEVDECFIGGKAKKRHWDKRDGQPGPTAGGKKAIIAGAVRRKGNVVARVVANVKRSTLEAFVGEAVSNKVSLLCTDQWVATAI
jgi:ribosomal protein L37AE/L43A